MKKKIIIRISNEIGNQLFMYASSLGIAKKLDRELYIDNETSFKARKNISKFGLDNFKISCAKANRKDKFLGIKGYIKRKLLKKIDFFFSLKNFYIEEKDENKNTKYNTILNKNLTNKTFFEGYFETEKYFSDIKDQIMEEFRFIEEDKYKKNSFFEKVKKNNTVSICLRQNRFVEGAGTYKMENIKKSEQFRDEQINYINKSILHIKKNLDNPIFYLWSNDLDNIDMSLFNTKLIKVFHNKEDTENVDKRALDLFLISQCNHHIVIPSSFNWWGAWLCKYDNKIICRPNDKFFSSFKLNNKDFWPDKWIEIS